ncbi:hypothetical protein [Teredinibacter sp. KSP-S5-2]|uniref:hypothetical protein n=1 Tax=Teredinibacter sp. KSP-S5-2 TaxID=3034506 RepID=UPI0029347E63|nr:hypothetical protein [Teredinibacter sp. KSP-S5-2]WNO11251.1 hypothetical protein P5V12_08700 [Teredinibacter sp. KSP-S5-2]
MKKFLTIGCLAASALLFTSTGYAEEVRIPIGQVQVGPKTGMTMEQVEAQYGAPESKNGPTGEPPIYFWEYPDFTVYFEQSYVIHTVSKRLPPSK